MQHWISSRYLLTQNQQWKQKNNVLVNRLWNQSSEHPEAGNCSVKLKVGKYGIINDKLDIILLPYSCFLFTKSHISLELSCKDNCKFFQHIGLIRLVGVGYIYRYWWTILDSRRIKNPVKHRRWGFCENKLHNLVKHLRYCLLLSNQKASS